jgi:hypothetical protein
MEIIRAVGLFAQYRHREPELSAATVNRFPSPRVIVNGFDLGPVRDHPRLFDTTRISNVMTSS